MTPQSLLASANNIIKAAAARSAKSGSSQKGSGSRGPRPRWPRPLLSLFIGAPVSTAQQADAAGSESRSPVIMAAMGRRRRGRGPRPIAFPRNRRRG